MRSLHRRFNIKREIHTNLGDYIVLAIAVKMQRFSKRVIQTCFDTCIDKNDYDIVDRKSLLQFLYKINFNSEDDIK